ncbi:hypothetical protein V5O48_001858 [Marasmius crinis-equi]|uniref:Uncharacterized protein n=1 Tax=Marasmius crinis-equi TaxID=585013 RepID=A0ABR3FX78_9AGAR
MARTAARPRPPNSVPDANAFAETGSLTIPPASTFEQTNGGKTKRPGTKKPLSAFNAFIKAELQRLRISQPHLTRKERLAMRLLYQEHILNTTFKQIHAGDSELADQRLAGDDNQLGKPKRTSPSPSAESYRPFSPDVKGQVGELDIKQERTDQPILQIDPQLLSISVPRLFPLSPQEGFRADTTTVPPQRLVDEDNQFIPSQRASSPSSSEWSRPFPTNVKVQVCEIDITRKSCDESILHIDPQLLSISSPIPDHKGTRTNTTIAHCSLQSLPSSPKSTPNDPHAEPTLPSISSWYTEEDNIQDEPPPFPSTHSLGCQPLIVPRFPHTSAEIPNIFITQQEVSPATHQANIRLVSPIQGIPHLH